MKNTFALLIAVALLCACKNNEEQASESASPIDHQQSVQPGNVGDLDDIELNEGDLWKVFPHISEGIESMIEIVNSNNPEYVEEYQALGENLYEETRELENYIQSDQIYSTSLNQYWNSLEQKIENLRKVNSEEEAAQIVSEIEQHLHSFSSYFQ